MIIVNTLKLLSLAICCALATKTDLGNGTISNKLIAVFGIVSILLNGIAIFLSSIDDNILFFKNAGSLIGIAFLLYFLHIWAGGDCKLLIIVALLYPSSLYWKLDSTQFTLWYTLVFMFGIGFLYLIAESICLWVKEKNKVSIGIYLKSIVILLVQYLKALVFMSALSHVYLLYIHPYFSIPTVIYTTICIVYIWILNSYHIFESKLALVCFFVFDLLMTLFTGNVTVSKMWITYLITIVFMIARLFINQYNYRTIDTINLKEGMILSKMSTLLMQNSRVSGLPGVSDESLKSRISKDEVDSIIRWSKTKHGYKQVIIVRKMPFAVFISCGVLMYLAFLGVLQ